jgi:ketosteroid isomerase-like protein
MSCIRTAIVIVATLAGCSRAEPGNELGQRWLDALNSHDATRVVALMEPTATYADPTLRQPLAPAALSAWLTQAWSVWKDRVYTPTRVLALPGSIVIEWHVEQSHPSGKGVPMDGVTILDLRDGRIHAARSYYDISTFLQFVAPQ